MFVFTTLIVKSVYILNPKLQAFSKVINAICVRTCQKSEKKGYSMMWLIFFIILEEKKICYFYHYLIMKLYNLSQFFLEWKSVSE